MDPDTTVRYLNAYFDGRPCGYALVELAESLRFWLSRGGFPPSETLSRKARRGLSKRSLGSLVRLLDASLTPSHPPI